ncbi:hypothetical protein HDU76_004207 [Blyttiomyces sp. JEL0837]|nr:hypothetical protein HDU76_004207 [Blyttiomyces sp. JEL0837]
MDVIRRLSWKLSFSKDNDRQSQQHLQQQQQQDQDQQNLLYQIQRQDEDSEATEATASSSTSVIITNSKSVNFAAPKINTATTIKDTNIIMSSSTIYDATPVSPPSPASITTSISSSTSISISISISQSQTPIDSSAITVFHLTKSYYIILRRFIGTLEWLKTRSPFWERDTDGGGKERLIGARRLARLSDSSVLVLARDVSSEITRRQSLPPTPIESADSDSISPPPLSNPNPPSDSAAPAPAPIPFTTSPSLTMLLSPQPQSLPDHQTDSPSTAPPNLLQSASPNSLKNISIDILLELERRYPRLKVIDGGFGKPSHEDILSAGFLPNKTSPNYAAGYESSISSGMTRNYM